MKKAIFILFFAFIFQFVSAHGIILKGKIYEKYNGKDIPLEYVTVKVKGTSNDVTTNINGEYRIECSKGDVIRILYLGYKPVEWVVGDSIEKDFYLEIIDNPLDNIPSDSNK